MSIAWKRPRPAPAGALGEMLDDVARLAQDDFRPRPLRGWEILGFYGERT